MTQIDELDQDVLVMETPIASESPDAFAREFIAKSAVLDPSTVRAGPDLAFRATGMDVQHARATALTSEAFKCTPPAGGLCAQTVIIVN